MTETSSEQLVRIALAAHLAVAPEVIDEAQRLERDLGLDALDLVLVALRLENVLEAEIDIADLESLVTVRDFMDVVLGARVTLPGPEPRSSSGLYARLTAPGAAAR
jgi:acyl carrier protein